MAKNLIPIIAKELGVEIGEVFEIEGDVGCYRFTNNNLEWLDDSCPSEWEIAEAAGSIIWDMLQGFSVIVKPPFEPKWKDKYFTYASYNWEVIEDIWEDTLPDYMRKVSGCVFRSYEEAYSARPAKYKEVTGKKW